MKVLLLGDIVGKPGRRVVARHLSGLRRELGVDVVIANVENAAGGFGLTKLIYNELLDYGIDVFTSGNHIFDNKDILDDIDALERLLRPSNYPKLVPGKGLIKYSSEGNSSLYVLNLQGRVFMPSTDCPFMEFDELYEEVKGEGVPIIVDFHGEATAEKQAFSHYANGRACAVIGTHTHVQTSDERILSEGTAYITDVGMCGVYDSVIGMDVKRSIKHLVTQMNVRFTPAKGRAILQGVVVECDGLKATSIERINIFEDLYDKS
ncbi:MAG: TIGR00282 family metallophosphoesterase [Candidatus Coatesbacteria bacterium]|nr:MAG: TIGR00282 family metallophosphoesterase [Candidatus Coatesbacteria bacterium]